jgi:hypothetical protein
VLTRYTIPTEYTARNTNGAAVELIRVTGRLENLDHADRPIRSKESAEKMIFVVDANASCSERTAFTPPARSANSAASSPLEAARNKLPVPSRRMISATSRYGLLLVGGSPALMATKRGLRISSAIGK